MPALSFQKQFAPKVEAGEKTQTVRAKRKHPIKDGDNLMLYTGMRTKYCRMLGYGVCKDVSEIQIVWNENHSGRNIIINDKVLNPEEMERFAMADGFGCFEEFFSFFKAQGGFLTHCATGIVTWEGDVISWDFKGRPL